MREMAGIYGRRAQLLARAAVERERVAVQLALWQAPLALADKGLSAARYLRSHPAILLAAVAITAALKPRRALAWARRAFLAWRAWRWISARLPQKPAAP